MSQNAIWTIESETWARGGGVEKELLVVLSTLSCLAFKLREATVLAPGTLSHLQKHHMLSVDPLYTCSVPQTIPLALSIGRCAVLGKFVTNAQFGTTATAICRS